MTADTVGGVWTFALELAEQLAVNGVEVLIAAMGGERTAPDITGVCILNRDYKLEWMDDPWDDVAEAGRWLQALEAQFAPDLIHLNTYTALGCSAPVVLTAHSCVLSWWDAVKHAPLPAHWDRYRQTVSETMRAASVLIAPTEAMLRAAETHYPIPGHRGVIANGRNPRHFTTAEKEPLILTAGRLRDEAKNAVAVARIAPRLPWPVYLAGDCAGLPGCRRLGRLEPTELAQYFSRAAIYCSPARYEPFGLSALEAALCGCALVLGDIESLHEVWHDAATYVPPDDHDRLATVLNNLIADPTRREEMAHRACLRARTYTPERMAAGYLDAYQAALERRPACVS
jgi:glycosyltransferase involved in cell wall biosynthesis